MRYEILTVITLAGRHLHNKLVPATSGLMIPDTFRQPSITLHDNIGRADQGGQATSQCSQRQVNKENQIISLEY